MSTIIVDSCSYTPLGLTDYLVSRGVRKRQIIGITTVEELVYYCQIKSPEVVFINEDCFIHDAELSLQIKQLLLQHTNTLFHVFMAIDNIHYDAYLLISHNLLISSKAITPASLDKILADYFARDTQRESLIKLPTLTLSHKESHMLKMWMSGQGTLQISDQMNIKAKTVSSHKGNIKRKVKTHNKQVISHLVRIMSNITNVIVFLSICVNFSIIPDTLWF